MTQLDTLRLGGVDKVIEVSGRGPLPQTSVALREGGHILLIGVSTGWAAMPQDDLTNH